MGLPVPAEADRRLSQLPMTLSMLDGVMNGQLFPARIRSSARQFRLVERGLADLDWLVVRDFAMTETANFWQEGRLVCKGELQPEDIRPKFFCAVLARRARRTAPSPIPAACAVARQSAERRRATAAPIFGSSTTSASG